MIAAAGGLCASWLLPSALCCAANICMSACCSAMSCFTCGSHTRTRAHARVAKVLYLLIFMLSAVLGIVLRYYGESALSSWVSAMRVCESGQCWGVQADYRISAAVTGFFTIMALLTAVCSVAHFGAWLLKLLFFIALLGASLAMPNTFFAGYAEMSRYVSVLFLLVQVVILVDFAYIAHEALLARMDATDRDMERAGWEPGLCSNGWKVLYVSVAFLLVAASIAVLGVLFHFFGACSLTQFFLAQTLAVGVLLIMASLPAGKGLLPPCILFAYNTYLVYGAITNNPDTACNQLARAENQDQGSIITGLIITVLSITWAAFASAGSLTSVLGVRESQKSESQEVPTIVTSADIEASAGADKTQEWAPPKTTAKAAGTAASYDSGSGAAARAPQEDESEEEPPRIWVFHIVMALGGVYLAMLLTNWGEVRNVNNGNPELSTASMWVRMVTQWLIYLLYGWTLLAPVVCTSRDFS